MKSRRKAGRHAELPFRIDRASRQNLSNQVADGLREAIATGFFKPGDILPNLDEMSRQLGVSLRIPREAVERLKCEGIVNPRPGVGCQVLAKREMMWRGRVLFICTDEDEVTYYVGSMIASLRRILADNGYLLSCVSGMVKSSGKVDYALLGPALLQHADFAFVLGYFPEVFKLLYRSSIPFAAIGNTSVEIPGFAGLIKYDNEPAFKALVERSVAAGVKTVEQIDFEFSRTVDATAQCEAAGISINRVIIPPKKGIGWLEGIMRASSEYFRSRLFAGEKLPDLLFFAEDVVAFGALPALEAAGVRIPEDVKVVTCAQLGYEPVFPKTLDRILTNPREHGVVLADYVISFLGSGKAPENVTLRPSYAPGETMV